MSLWSLVLSLCSFALFCWGLLRFFLLSRQQRLSRRLLHLTLAVVGAVFLVEWAGLAARGEALFPSEILISTMQVFSLDAGYEALTGGPQATDGALAGPLYWYRAIVYSVAPIVGGAIIYDVLAGISPDLRLLALRRRRMLIFSQLNERSLLLAEDLLRRERGGKTALVFTGWEGEAEGDQAELLARAKDLHAVCLEEELVHCRGFRHSRFCSFFLLSLNKDGVLDDAANLAALEGLLSQDTPAWNRERGCAITLISDDSQVLENVRALKRNYDERVGDKRVTVRLVRDRAMACIRHLDDAPLFRDLETERQSLDLVLFGKGPFAREMLRTVYWQGQMLDHPLRIALVYPPADRDSGAEPELATALRRFNPELLDACTPGHECLRIRPDRPDCAPVYASLYFVEAEVMTQPMEELLTAPRPCQYGDGGIFPLAQASRFLVMGDSDGDNVALADELRRCLSLLKGSGAFPGKKTVSVLVESSDTRRVVSQRFRDYARLDETRVRPDMLLFGDLEDRYRWENVWMDGEDLARLRERRSQEALLHSLKDVSASRDDLYNDWSRVARAFHMPVKMYCAGVREGDELDRKLQYQRALDPLDGPLVDRLRWLEHRRWNAFLRAQGFCRPPRLTEMLSRLRAGELKPEDWRELCFCAYKNIPARLHPCLVECLDYNNGPEDKDLLDLVSDLRDLVNTGRQAGQAPASGARRPSPPSGLRHREVEPAPLGLKRYDSPYGSNGPRLSGAELAELARRLGLTGETGPDALAERFPLLRDCRAGEDEYFLDMVLQVLEPEGGGAE